MVHDPHVPGAFKRNTQHIAFERRQQRCYLMRDYRGKGSTVEHSQLSGILQSCRPPGSQGAWPSVAAGRGASA